MAGMQYAAESFGAVGNDDVLFPCGGNAVHHCEEAKHGVGENADSSEQWDTVARTSSSAIT